MTSNVALSRENSIQKMWLFNESYLCLFNILDHEKRFLVVLFWHINSVECYIIFPNNSNFFADSPKQEWITSHP